MSGVETTNWFLSTQFLMTVSMIIFLVMSLTIWLKLKAMSIYRNMIVVYCPDCGKKIEVAYNSINDELECPDCQKVFFTHSN